jgi:hypothetical protein
MGCYDMTDFMIRVNNSPTPVSLKVKTSVYRDAVAAVPAIFGLDLPVDVEIWCEHLIPEYGPYHYRIEENEFVGLVVKHDLGAYQ